MHRNEHGGGLDAARRGRQKVGDSGLVMEEDGMKAGWAGFRPLIMGLLRSG